MNIKKIFIQSLETVFNYIRHCIAVTGLSTTNGRRSSRLRAYALALNYLLPYVYVLIVFRFLLQQKDHFNAAFGHKVPKQCSLPDNISEG